MTAPEFDATSFVALVFKTKDGFGETVKFVPSDLHDDTKAQLAECEARLRKAVEALRGLLRFTENTESELGIILGSGCKARAVLAEIEKGGV